MGRQSSDRRSDPVAPSSASHNASRGVAGFDGRLVDLPDDVYDAVAGILIAAARQEDAEAVTAS